jgi:hypothetical protein
MKFEKFPDEKIEHYWDEVCILLEEMGFHPDEVLVTDESELIEFFMIDDEEDWIQLKKTLEWRYNVKVKYEDRIWKVAENMRYAE